MKRTTAAAVLVVLWTTAIAPVNATSFTITAPLASHNVLVDFNRDGVFDAIADAGSQESSLLAGLYPLIGAFPDGVVFRIPLEFNLAEIPNGATIDSAQMSISLEGCGLNSPLNYCGSQFNIMSYVGNGTIELADAYASAPFVSFPSVWRLGAPGSVVRQFDATTLISDFHQSGDEWVGLLIRSANEDVPSYVEIDAQYASQAQFRPTLTVTYTATIDPPVEPPIAVPEPATFALLGLGLVAIAASRRRRLS